MQKIAALVFVLGMLVGMPLRAQPQVGDGSFVSGAQLIEMCRTENSACTGYVAGVVDALAPLSESGGLLPVNSLASFCAPKQTVKQAITEFRKFIKNNPEGLQTNAAQLVGDALHLAHPCARK